MKKSFRRILATVLTVVMVITAVPLSGITDFDWENLFATKASASYYYDLKSLPSTIPEYPENGQTFWIIFNEGYRSNRLEMSTFNVSGNVSDLRIVWNGSLRVETKGTVSRCNQYSYTEQEWEYIGEYGILSDYATEVFASNVNVYDSNGNIMVSASEWRDKKSLLSYSVGDTIEFGSYPQSKVTDSATISALDAKSKSWKSYGYYSGSGSWSDGLMKPSDYMKYCDISYNDNKYRAVTFSSYRPYFTGYTSSASYTYQDDNGYYTGNVYYFKYEPLKWRVLDPSEGFVMCEKAIDSQAYNNYILYSNSEYWGDSSHTYYASDWANSSIRAWLNDDFYNTAFSSAEKSQIGTTYNENQSTASPQYNSVNTYDKIFFLSWNEILNTKFGFSSSNSTSDTARRLKSTDYAQCQGCNTSTSMGYLGNSEWRLRSPNNSGYAAKVNNDGYAIVYCVVDVSSDGVVPAFKFNPKSSITEPEVNPSEEAEQEYVNQHLDFIKSSKYTSALSKRYAEYLYEGVYGTTGKNTAEFCYDVMEGVYEEISLKAVPEGFSMSKNPYDNLIISLLASPEIGAQITEKLEVKIYGNFADVFNKAVKAFQPEEKWSEPTEITEELEKLYKLMDTAEYKDYKDNKMFVFISDMLENVSKDDINNLFNGFAYAGDVLGYVKDGLSIVNYFFECLRYVSYVNAFLSTSEEFKLALKVSGEMIPDEGKTFRDKFNEAYSRLENTTTPSGYISEIIKYIGTEQVKTSVGLCRSLMKTTTNDFIKKAGIGANAASYILAVFWAYEVGFKIANLLTSNNEAVDLRRQLRANYWLEQGSYYTLKSAGKRLNDEQTYSNAKYFDEAFKIFKFMQTNAIELHLNAVKTNAKYNAKVFTGPLTIWANPVFFNQDKYTSEFAAWGALLDEWKRIKCHYDAFGIGGGMGSRDNVQVACPTDVYIYNPDGSLAASVINDSVTINNDDVFVFVLDGVKEIYATDIENYKIVVKATDNGTMSFSCSQYENDRLKNTVSFDEVSITNQQTYQFVVAGNNIDVSSKSCLKKSDSSKITTSVTHIHQWGEPVVEKEATTTSEGISKVICSKCGYTYRFTTEKKSSDIDFSKLKVGDTIEFGSYPQSKVTDSATISALDKISKSWISYGYYSGTGDNSDGNMKPDEGIMYYSDISYNGNVYRAVKINQYRPYWTGYTSSVSSSDTYSYQYDNGYYTGKVYYFKYEPLTWKVLDPSDGLVVCNKAIDSQAYNNYYLYYNNNNGDFYDDCYGNSSKDYYASDWVNSSLREWLNNDFYGTAFSSNEKSHIGTTYNENDSTFRIMYSSADTSDKIFLLSYNQVSNSQYGFNSNSGNNDITRQLKSTDYAMCQGCWKNTDTSYDGNTSWWLRSPETSGTSAYVYYNGSAIGSIGIGYCGRGIVPAFKYKKILNYVVNFNANGGSVSPTSASVEEGKSVTLPTPTKNYTITYNANGGSNAPESKTRSVGCKGWSTSISATTADYSCGANYTPISNTTLYAVWGSYASGSVSSSKLTRSGYTFLGWSESSSATSPTYTPGENITFTRDMTLYAVWKANDTGKVKSVSINDVEVKYKSAAKIVPQFKIDDGVEYTVKYESSNPSVATVDKDGNITTLHKGDTTITCTITDEYGNVVKDTCNVNVYFSFGQWLIWILLLGFLWY